MKVKVRIFFREVETEIELPNNLKKEDIEQELNEQIEIDYFEEV